MMTGICILSINSNVFQSVYAIFSLTISFTVGSVKLILYCYFGEMISNNFKKLIDKLDKNSLKREFSQEESMHFTAIKELEQKLTFKVYGFKLKRGTLLTIIAFILQYAVILIQTDSMNNEFMPSFPDNSTHKIMS
jgi:hypothetical protein